MRTGDDTHALDRNRRWQGFGRPQFIRSPPRRAKDGRARGSTCGYGRRGYGSQYPRVRFPVRLYEYQYAMYM